MNVELINHWGNDLMIVNAARVSLNKHKSAIDLSDEKLIKYLIKNKHWSCFEHCGFTFRIKVPVFVARQIMRHRSHSFNEISGRYVEFEDDFFTPCLFREQSSSIKQGSKLEKESNLNQWLARLIYNSSCTFSFFCYKILIKLGVCKEQSRAVLPLALYTQLYLSCNLRSFIHFLDLRLDSHSQQETREIAQKMLDLAIDTNSFTISLSKYRDNIGGQKND